MKKFKLNLEELKVESFETSKAKSGVGTVHGNEPQTEAGCEPPHSQNIPDISLCTCGGVGDTCAGYCGTYTTPKCPPASEVYGDCDM